MRLNDAVGVSSCYMFVQGSEPLHDPRSKLNTREDDEENIIAGEEIRPCGPLMWF